MDLVLKRNQYREDGIFGEITDANGEVVALTLEHAFDDGADGWKALIPQGTYSCVRGEHYLHGMTKPFFTFEVSGVDGHAGLLFHWGNYNYQSSGCILLGDKVSNSMLLNSKITFQRFMDTQKGLLLFQLLVI
jgi:hypothetical protein